MPTCFWLCKVQPANAITMLVEARYATNCFTNGSVEGQQIIDVPILDIFTIHPWQSSLEGDVGNLLRYHQELVPTLIVPFPSSYGTQDRDASLLGAKVPPRDLFKVFGIFHW